MPYPFFYTMEEIQQWLTTPNKSYELGVALYAQHGRNKNLKKLFTRPANTQRMEKLVYELNKISNEFKPPQKAKKIASTQKLPTSKETAKPFIELAKATNTELKARVIDGTTKHATSMYPKIVFENLPEQLQTLYIANQEKIKLRRLLHDKLEEITSSADRAPICVEIRDLAAEITANFNTLKQYQENGTIEEPKKEGTPSDFGDLTPLQQDKKRRTCRSSISKAIKRINDWKKALIGLRDEKKKHKLKAKIKGTEATLAKNLADVKILDELLNV